MQLHQLLAGVRLYVHPIAHLPVLAVSVVLSRILGQRQAQVNNSGAAARNRGADSRPRPAVPERQPFGGDAFEIYIEKVGGIERTARGPRPCATYATGIE